MFPDYLSVTADQLGSDSPVSVAIDGDNYGPLVSACKSAGAAFYIEPDTPIPTGARSFGVLDPDGNKLLFIEEPAA